MGSSSMTVKYPRVIRHVKGKWNKRLRKFLGLLFFPGINWGDVDIGRMWEWESRKSGIGNWDREPERVILILGGEIISLGLPSAINNQ